MNKIERNKKILIGVSIGVIVLSLIFIAVGIMLIVFGGNGLASTDSRAGAVLKLVFGILMLLLGLVGSGFGIMFAWTGGYLKATHGSIAEDNLGKGTVGMKKCQVCGTEFAGNETFCSSCGARADGTKTCPACGETNLREARNCTKCGKDL